MPRSWSLPSRFLRTALVLALLGTVLTVAARPDVADAIPVADDDTSYELCGRVFPDPHAYWPSPAQLPAMSPWAKGNATCKAIDFLSYADTVSGLQYLETLVPDYMEVYDLSDPNGPFASILDLDGGEGMSAGLPTETLERDRAPLYVIRVTDETSTEIPIADRAHFAYTLSIHGIERAGAEGGVRAIEDLTTWAACEADESALSTCALNGPFPHPLMETIPDESISAGEALERTSIWFVLGNPDGWRRGDKLDGGFAFQRYNGNGMDMNRDWPAIGFTHRPFTPHSEPETRTFGKVLRSVKDDWTGGIDLHGQQIDRAFSFTLLGGEERPFDKDRRVLQFTKGAFADAEVKLAWSPIIKPNDDPPSCVELGLIPTSNISADCDPTNRLYGVQWGTVWDTIAYTTTGSNDAWMASELGLGADAIGNEMSLSHITNCYTGNCFLPDFEQLHVDGNKSLIYAMVHYSLLPEDTDFSFDGTAAWLAHDERVSHPGSDAPGTTSDLPPQDGFETDLTIVPGTPVTFEFDVLGERDGVHNGAISTTISSTNVGGISGGATFTFAIDQLRPDEENPGQDTWTEQNSYFNQSPIYLQAGARIDVNAPAPGKWRLRVEGLAPGQVHADVDFLSELAWPDPGQRPYDVSNLDFFEDLQPFATSPLDPISLDALLDGSADLDGIDSLIIADGAFLPGFTADAGPTRDVAQDPVVATLAMGAPGVGVRTDASSTFFEFDVEAGHTAIDAVLDSPTVADPDLYLQRQLPDGSWTDDLASGASASVNTESLTYADPIGGRYRIEAHNYAGAPGDATLTVTFSVPAPAASATAGAASAVAATDFTAADETALLDLLRTFVEGGGNLVLTDDAMLVLERLGLVPDGSVTQETVYAGFVEFSADGGATSTYDDPLSANVQQAGAAEGPNHRHQMSEPVPTGFSIMDADGSDQDSMPQWVVDRAAFEDAGGRIAGTANGGVTLGELIVGDGQIRFLGSLLPVPTEEYAHPYGLASHAITYSGYETFRNMLDASTPAVPPVVVSPDAQTPNDTTGATGTLPDTGSDLPWALVGLLLAGVAAAVWQVRRRPARS